MSLAPSRPLGNVVLVAYGHFGATQLAILLDRARDGVRWRARKYLRKSKRWTGTTLVHPREFVGRPPSARWVDDALAQDPWA